MLSATQQGSLKAAGAFSPWVPAEWALAVSSSLPHICFPLPVLSSFSFKSANAPSIPLLRVPGGPVLTSSEEWRSSRRNDRSKGWGGMGWTGEGEERRESHLTWAEGVLWIRKAMPNSYGFIGCNVWRRDWTSFIKEPLKTPERGFRNEFWAEIQWHDHQEQTPNIIKHHEEGEREILRITSLASLVILSRWNTLYLKQR